MSRIYDNWERLVAAVLKREEFRHLCRCESLESTTSTISVPSDVCPSPSSNSRFDSTLNLIESEVQKTASQIDHEGWIERYESGVYIRLAAKGDGTTGITGVRFSRRRFKERDAYFWFLNNRENIYKKYNDTARLAMIRLEAVSGRRGHVSKLSFLNKREGSKVPKESNKLISLTTTKLLILRTTTDV